MARTVRSRRAARRLGDVVVERLLPLDRAGERCERLVLEPQQRGLLRELAKVFMCAREVGAQLHIRQHRQLQRKPFDRIDAAHQGAARARRCRSPRNRAAALLGQALGMPGRIEQRADQRQRHEQKGRDQQAQE
jgi:hypothetical protein